MAPLDGLRVIDLTRVLAGPYCTMMLGDMGADVIKIEEPSYGDEIRNWAPFVGDTSLYFTGVNRNKRSVALDLRTPAGAEALHRLLVTADVLVENFRPGSLSRLGFGYEQTRKANPAIIYCSISGYGQTGPRREEPGYDPVIQAESGLMDVTGPRGGEPTRCGVPVVDYVAGLYASQGILLALLDRQRTGQGQYLDIALLDCITATMVMQHGLVQVSGAAPRLGNEHPAIAPYETLAASDGLVMVAVGNDRLWRQFCAALDLTPLLEDDRFATNSDRLRHRPALRQTLEAAIRDLTVEQVVARLRERQVPCGRVRSAADAFRDPQLEARGMFVEFPDFPGVRALAHPVRLSPSSPVSPRRPPAVGEHTREVLAELGYAPAQIDAMCGRNSNLRSEGTDHEDHRVHADRASSGGVSAPD
jgi:crotonobetainyl-CoA:carnitine CoA-transferase CaiB-like acyl-CoA transferase